MRQAWIEPEAEVGGAGHLLDELAERGRQALAAVFLLGVEGGPARLAEGIVGLAKTLGRAHDAVLVGAAFEIARGVQRQQHLLAKLGGLGEYGFYEFGVDAFEPELLEFLDVVQLAEHEAHVAKGGFVDLHFIAPTSNLMVRSTAGASRTTGLI